MFEIQFTIDQLSHARNVEKQLYLHAPKETLSTTREQIDLVLN